MTESLSILVVDDSSTMTKIICDLLQKLGYADIDVAQDGRTALDRMRVRKYDLVLSDWEMQPMGGSEFLKEIRQDPKTGRVPIILITAKTSRGSSWLAGANAFLSKPFSENELKIAIKSALGTGKS